MSVLIETSFGDIVVDLFYDECPVACENFIKLCKIKFYHSCLFHTVYRDFIALTGDPDNTGEGGNSIWGVIKDEKIYFKNEFHTSLSHNRPGLLSTANKATNKNTSSFFITLAGGLERLDKKHTIFGEIAEGFDVLMQLNNAYCDDNHHPIQVIRIRHTDILDDPFPTLNGISIPDSSPEPPKLPDGRLDDEIIFNPNEGKTEEEIREEESIHQAEANAEVLMMLGDIKNKDEAPPENVLFLCKLNPITEEEDLELLFSQFGKVIGCEIIKDHITGDSLCFGFIEFSDRSSCERAYLKMDNVLIDDRRVHVDFSQSTSRHTSKSFSKDSSNNKKSRYGHLTQRNQSENYDTRKSDHPSRSNKHTSHSSTVNPKKRTRDFEYSSSSRKKFRTNSPDREIKSHERKYDHKDRRYNRDRDYNYKERDNREYRNDRNYRHREDRDYRHREEKDYYKESRSNRNYSSRR